MAILGTPVKTGTSKTTDFSQNPFGYSAGQASGWSPSPGMKTTAASTLGGVIGGSVAGIPGTYFGSQIGGKFASGGFGSPEQDQESMFGPKPELAPWVGMNQADIRATDLYRPTTITGSDIQRQMEESPWYKMSLEKQGAEQAQLMDQAARQQAGAMAGARTQLAMRGGLRGGTAERLAMSGAENAANLMQQQRQAGAIERGRLGTQAADLASRIAQQNAQTMTEAQARNIGAGVGELDKQRAYDLARYQEQMKGYAAERTAQALGKEPKPSIFSDPFGYLGQYFK